MKKVFFAAGTLLPIAYGLSMLIFGFSDTPLERGLRSIYGVVIAASVVLFVAYFVDIWRNERLTSEKKTLWSALIVFGTFFAGAAYVWFHVLRVPQPRGGD